MRSVLTLLFLAPLATPQESGRTPVPIPRASTGPSGVEPAQVLPTCAKTVEDLSTGDCVAVDSTPTLGRLYPLGPEFSIDPAGNVSFGSGSVCMAGGLFLHTLGGVGNTALGGTALENVTTGFDCTAAGYRALRANTTGFRNTAVGSRALVANTTGLDNVAVGARAMINRGRALR